MLKKAIGNVVAFVVIFMVVVIVTGYVFRNPVAVAHGLRSMLRVLANIL